MPGIAGSGRKTMGTGLRAVAGLCLLVSLAACGPTTTERLDLPPLETVAEVDLERYMGTWYEIASYPQWFQEGCTGTTANYAMRDDGRVDVLNRCFKGGLDGEEDAAEGIARVVDTDSNARLEVSFFRPFWGAYWVIELGQDYDYAVVGHPGRDYLWILSRSPQMDAALYRGILTRLEQDHQYDVSRLQLTPQPGA
jgi:apolipoprotein D and lipocalin family protein